MAKVNFLGMTPRAILRAAEFFGDLLPALKMLKKVGENAKVLSALAAAKGAVIDSNNIRLRKTFSIRKVEKQVLTDNDPSRMIKDIIHKYATLNTDRAFVHAYPGRLLTSIFSSDSSSFTRHHEFGYMLGTSLYQESEEYMLHGFFSTVWGAFRIGEKGDDVGMTKFLESDEARRSKLLVANALLPKLRQEQDHLKAEEIVRRPRESDTRVTCDTCMTSLFSTSFMCRLCGREVCNECFQQVSNLTQAPQNATPAEMKAFTAKREQYAAA